MGYDKSQVSPAFMDRSQVMRLRVMADTNAIGKRTKKERMLIEEWRKPMKK